MTTTTSTQGIKTVLHPVADLAASKTMYTALLGVEPAADSPYYVGYDVEGQDPDGNVLGLLQDR